MDPTSTDGAGIDGAESFWALKKIARMVGLVPVWCDLVFHMARNVKTLARQLGNPHRAHG